MPVQSIFKRKVLCVAKWHWQPLPYLFTFICKRLQTDVCYTRARAYIVRGCCLFGLLPTFIHILYVHIFCKLFVFYSVYVCIFAVLNNINNGADTAQTG